MTVKVLTIKEDILGMNKAKAGQNRERLHTHGILAVNVMSSPGSGKTSLILRTISGVKANSRIAVIEGDIASQVDADKVHEQGVPVIQINTGDRCHLDANMMEKAMDHLALGDIDLLLIENVGNLVCPAEFDLGEHRKVMILSAPEGDDKPYKYPLMFTEADVVLINKVDLLPYLDFDLTRFIQVVSGLNPKARILPISCKTGEGLEAWLSWLVSEMDDKKTVSK